MLVRATDHFRPTRALSKLYKGIVRDNVDPLQIGRIKAEVPGLLELTQEQKDKGDYSFLPWCHIHAPIEEGAQTGSSSFEVPAVGTEVIVEFPFDDIYAPFYTARWVSSVDRATGAAEDYPNTTIKRDSSGNVTKINKAKGTHEFFHSSGASVCFEKDGQIIFKTPKGFKVQSTEGNNEFSFDANNGEIVSRSNGDGSSTLEGAVTKIITKGTHSVQAGEVLESTTGGKDENIGGGKRSSVGGSEARSTVGNLGETIGGSKSLIVTSTTSETYGAAVERTYALGGVVEQLLAGNKEIQLLLGNIEYILTAGNYSVDILAGNLNLSTTAGTFNLSNALAKIEGGIDGSIKVTVGTTFDVTATVSASLVAPMVKLGPTGSSPIIPGDLNPLEDFLTGKPKILSFSTFCSP